MKFRSSRTALEHALSVVTHVIDSHATLPVLSNILIKAAGKKVHFSATNLEMAVNYWMEAEVINEGSVTVPAKLFSGYISLLKDEEVECTMVEGLSLAINSAGSKTKMKCIAAAEYPTIGKLEEVVSFEIPTEDFPQAIEQVCFAASTANTRPVLSGVLVEVEGKQVMLVATDSFRLSEKKIALTKAVAKSATCIIPVRGALEMARLASAETDAKKVKIIMGKNQVLAEIGNIEFYSRLIEGNFPNYRQIMPRSIRTSTTLTTGDQALAVKRVNLFARENNNKVLFDFQTNKLKLTTPVTQVGEEEGELPISLSGDPGTIALNSEFVLDALAHLGTDQVEMGMNDSKSPAVFKPVGKDDFVHIIMPLKLQ